MKGSVGGPDAAAVEVESPGGIPSACLFFTREWIVLRAKTSVSHYHQINSVHEAYKKSYSFCEINALHHSRKH